MVAVPRYRPGRGRNLATRAPCLYPGCRRYVDELPTGGGRPRMFCSDDCRANFSNIQRQMTKLVADLTIKVEDARDEHRRDLARDLARADWHLARFRHPDVTTYVRGTTVPNPGRPLLVRDDSKGRDPEGD